MSNTIPERLRRRLVRLLSSLVIAGLILPAVPVLAAPPAQGANALRDCSGVQEDTLQDELNTVSQQIFAEQIATLELDDIIARQWVTLEMNRAMDEAVDLAVARVQSETDLWDKFLSGWSPDLARDLTLAVATHTFDAPTFRAQMDELSAAIAQDIASQLALASADSASAALYCLQTFIDTHYAAALVRAFESRVQAATTGSQLLDAGDASPDILAMVGEHQMALGGIGVIIAAQITRKIVTSIAQRVSQRVAGRIAGRVLGRAGSTVIPLAGWIVGTGMIVYDLYESRDGALPQIQSSLKSTDVKDGVRDEIEAAIRPELATEIPALAREVANDLYAEWRTVKRDIQQVLDIAAADERFAALLASLGSQEQLAKLVTVVSIVIGAGGRPALDTAMADGTLERVLDLPDAALTLVRESGSLQTALAWSDAVGSRLSAVVAMELYKHMAPEDVDLTQLDQLLALGDKTAVARLALLRPEQAAELMTLATANVAALATTLAPDDLAWLADELPVLPQAQRNQIVARLLSQPAIIEPLRRSGALAHLAGSNSLDDGIRFLTGASEGLDYVADSSAVLNGTVTPGLFLAKYGVWPSVGGIAGIFVLLLIALRILWSFGSWLFQPLSFLRRRQ